MHSIGIIAFFLLFSQKLIVPGFAQQLERTNMDDIYEKNEQRLNDLLEVVGQKRLDVEGFMLYRNTDSIPQEVFLIPFPLAEFDDQKSFEENFIDAVSKPNASASEEVFMSMRHTMPALLSTLNQSMHLIVDSDYPPVFNGGSLRVIYGRIAYRVSNDSAFGAKPMVNSITVKIRNQNYRIDIANTNMYGYPNFFRPLK